MASPCAADSCNQPQRGCRVAGDAAAFAVDPAQRALGAGLALVGRGLVPAQRGGVVALDALPVGVEDAQAVLRHREPLLRGQRGPVRGLHVVLRHAAADQRHVGQVALCGGLALVGCLAVPLGGLLEVARDALALLVQEAEVGLRTRVALLGGLAEPARGGDGIGGDAIPSQVHVGERQLGIAIALLGRRLELAQRGGVVASAPGLVTLGTAGVGKRSGQREHQRDGTAGWRDRKPGMARARLARRPSIRGVRHAHRGGRGWAGRQWIHFGRKSSEDVSAKDPGAVAEADDEAGRGVDVSHVLTVAE